MLLAGLLMLISTPFHTNRIQGIGGVRLPKETAVAYAFAFLDRVGWRRLFFLINSACVVPLFFFLAVSSGRKEIMIKKWMIWRMIWDTCLVGVWHGRERCSADGIWCSPSMMWAGGLKKSKCGLPSCHWIHPSPADQDHISHTLHGARQIYYIFWTTQTWICIRWLFALYHGKPPWNHHLRVSFLLFPSISSKCKQNRPAPWSDLG